MSSQQLDTSGCVWLQHGHFANTYFEDLSPFERGYIEAAMRDIQWPDPAEGYGPSSAVVHFDWLAPETLARIIADCAVLSARVRNIVPTDHQQGAITWAGRQRGDIPDFPPLTPALRDDGKVYLAEVRS